MSSSIGMESVLAEMLELNRPRVESLRRLAAQELLDTKLELTTAQNVSKGHADEVTKKDNRVLHWKSLNDLMEQTSLEHNAECNSLREEVDIYTQHCDKLLDELKEQTTDMCHRFTSAPGRFAVEKVSDEIEVYLKEFEEISFEIQSTWDPDIETSRRLMENEPFTLLELPGSSTTEFRTDTLDALIFDFQENTKEQSVVFGQLENEIAALVKEEEIYGH
ncbi:uncharacterized protein LOC117643991 [Thrips palmi]|uniref:Uncharacterized protein LOC117643991 n=1 Tax=Thrips palmi TaxID=161013 RepID=A0A6P8YXV9_THRPL|nr:uncharacterized protein LOC117643991 [Thrips palmi]